ncbi:MAG: energy-coupling factor transporter transmembrane protein EcfT [Haloferacaceae archaeon]
MVAVGGRPESYAARLDPRTKLAVQFAAAVLVLASPRAGLSVVVALALVACAAARVDPLATLWEARAVVPLLVAAPAVESLTLGPPWVVPADAVDPAVAVARVPPLYLLGAAYAASTPPRESRAAVTWLVPGRAGVVLGSGVELLFRLLPRMRADLVSARRAANARLLDQRNALERIRVIGVTGVARAFRRADALALGLRARAFSTNPTLPTLALSRADAPALAFSVLCLVAAALATA